MKKIAAVFFALIQLSLYGVTPQQALQNLIEGNQRFSKDKSLHLDRTSERRQELISKQTPHAVIVGCSDSRVAPEIIFDQGIGDLFIVRVAGNVVGSLEQDSIEYSVIYLNSSLIMVLGHENCGAIDAVLSGKTQDIEAVAEMLQPAADATKTEKTNRLENTIKTNAEMVADQLSKSPALSPLIAKKKLMVVPAYYNFHTGKVELLQEKKKK
ncbi:MAG TPA: carbonic anhydrase [Rhabdochlamydiaceae bacterium]|jgi:carbonic anhydrase|nr:carbonic anhydrase [Rhabdochlamydiaceae bacterium]